MKDYSINHAEHFEVLINQNEENINENENNENIFDQINKTSKINLTRSVISLIDCFICFQPAENPLSCPKCHNFACGKCLLHYFNNQKNIEKQCPYCRGKIKYNELIKLSIVSDLEKIIEQNEFIDNKKIDEMINNKKKSINAKLEESKENIEKLKKSIENFEKNKKEYINYLIECQKYTEKKLNDYSLSLHKFLDLKINYQKNIENILNQYEEIKKKTENNYYKTNENIRELINDVLTLEKGGIIPDNINIPNNFKFTPFIKIYRINSFNKIVIKESDFRSKNIINFNYYNGKLGRIHLSLDNQNLIDIICKIDLETVKKREDINLLFSIKLKNDLFNGNDLILKYSGEKKNKISYTEKIQILDFFKDKDKQEIIIEAIEYIL